MAQDLICRPILCRDIAFSIFINRRYLKKKNIQWILIEEELNYLKCIHLWQEELEALKKNLNNFKMLKTTFNCLILIIFVIFCDF